MANNRILVTCKVCDQEDPGKGGNTICLFKTYLSGYYESNVYAEIPAWLARHAHEGLDHYLKFEYEIPGK